MHEPPQFTVPGGQEQAPPEQTWPGPHGMPHAPQFRISIEVSVHKVPHVVCAHVALHVPVEQNCAVTGQMLPHVPQLFGSPWVLRQRFPHAEYGAVQEHRPAWQNMPSTQTLPHDPQL
jgi:hypothetical protein